MILKNRWIKNKILTSLAVLLSVSLAGVPLTAIAKVEDDAIYTEDGIEDYEAELTRNKAQAVQTNLDPAWPHGPAVGAAGAVVMDAESGAVLYGKNMDKHLFPASITKLMTALLAYENLDPDDTVTFSENAVFGIEKGSSNIGMDVGEVITVREALYGLMVASANEVAVALGERVSGTEANFVALMNQRAIELGCKNTHFVTPNGLHDSDHYTTAYDMALIGREIYKHPDLVEYMSQLNYHFEVSAKQPDDFWILNTNDFLTGEIPCDDIVGGKTGYTDQARETLVSFAERDGKRLVCVIMREEPPYQYYDTIDLLDYAFNNFKQINIAQEENRFTQESANFLSSGPDIFGKSETSFYIDQSAMLMIPNNASFSDLTAEITPAPYETLVQEENSKDAEDEAQETEANASAGTEASDSAEGSTAAAAGTQSAAEVAAKTEPPKTDAVPVSSTMQENGDKLIGIIQYKYHDYSLGSANVLFRSAPAVSAADSAEDSAAVGSTTAAAEYSSPDDSRVPTSVHGIKALLFSLVHTGAHGSVYLNILLLMPILLALTFLLCILIFVYDHFAQRSTRRRKQQRRAQRANRENASNPDDYDDSYDPGQPPRFSREENSVRRTYESDYAPAGNSRRRTSAGQRTNPDRRRTSSGQRNTAGTNGRAAVDRRRTASGQRMNPDRRRTSYNQGTDFDRRRTNYNQGTDFDRRTSSSGQRRTPADSETGTYRRRTSSGQRTSSGGENSSYRRRTETGQNYYGRRSSDPSSTRSSGDRYTDRRNTGRRSSRRNSDMDPEA